MLIVGNPLAGAVKSPAGLPGSAPSDAATAGTISINQIEDFYGYFSSTQYYYYLKYF